jgi:hypothetical protein
MSASMLIEGFAEPRRRGFEKSRQERHTSFNAPFCAHTDLYSGHRNRYSLMLRNRIYYGLKPFVPQFLSNGDSAKAGHALTRANRRCMAYYAGLGAGTGKLARLAGGQKVCVCSDA